MRKKGGVRRGREGRGEEREGGVRRREWGGVRRRKGGRGEEKRVGRGEEEEGREG